MFGKKKVDKVKFDEYDFDDELDFDAGFDDPFSPSKDRNPVTDFGKGAYEGVKDTMKSPAFYGNVMRKALPQGYANAFDVADDIASRAQGLYNEVSTELRPAIRNVKRTLGFAKRAVDGLLPDKVSKKLDEWLADKEVEQQRQEINAQEMRISTDLAEIFKVQAQERQEEKSQEFIDRVIDDDRNRTLTEQLNSIRVGLSSMVNYQDKILINFQRKDLELKYRLFFLTSQLVDTAKATSADTIGLLRSIVKNTALPEYQKITQSEKFSELARERLFGAIQNRFAPHASDFLDRLFGALRNRVMESVENFKSGAQGALDMTEQGSAMADMAGGMEDMGLTKSGMAGQAAGSMGAAWLGEKFAEKFIKPRLEKNPEIVGTGHLLDYASRDYDQYLIDWANDNNMSGGIKGFVADIISEAGAARQNNTIIGGDDIMKAADPAIWDNLSRKSLVEIIPGYLARLLQAVERFRDPNVDLTSFDYRRSEFTGTADLAKRINAEATQGYEYDSMKRRTTDIVDQLDTDKTLSEEQRVQFQKGLLKHVHGGGKFSYSGFMEPSTFIKMGMEPKDAQVFAEMFADKLGRDRETKSGLPDMEAAKFLNTISRDIRDLKNAMPNPTELANIYANTGNREAVRASGIAKRSQGIDRVDDSFILSSFEAKLRGTTNDATPQSETPISGAGFSPYIGAGHRTVASGSDSLRDIAVFGEMRDILQDILKNQKDATRVSESEASRNDAYSNEKLDLLINTLQQQSVVKQADESLVLLTEIREALLDLNSQMANMATDTNDTEKSAVRKHYSRVAKKMRGLGGMALKPFKMLYNLGGKMNDGLLGTAKKAVFGIGGALAGIGDAINANTPMDVYVKGKPYDPVLREAEMRAGRYVDAITGKTITALKDIKGAVRDATTNEIVLTAEEFASGLFNHKGKQLTKGIVGWTRDKIARLFGYVSSELGAGIKIPLTLLSKGKQMVSNFLFDVPDVYVPGEKSPRLLGSIIRRGGYYSSKTGKPIYGLSDIDSDVMDADGNVKLTVDEIANGVVDKDGKPIVTMMQRIKGLIKKGLGIGVGVLAWGGRQLKKGLGDVKGIVGKLDPRKWKTPSSVKFGTNDKVVQSIDRIYALLTKFFIMQGMDPKDAETVAETVAEEAKGTVTKVTEGVKEASNTAKAKAVKVKDNLTTKVSKLAERAKKVKEDTETKGKSKFQEIRDRTIAQRTKIADKLKTKKEQMQERGNSWLNILAARRAKAAEAKGKDVDGKPAKDKSKGLMSKLIGIVMGIGGILSTGFGMLKGLIGGIGQSIAKWWGIKTAASAAGTAAGGYAAGKAGQEAGKQAAKKGLLRRAAGGLGRAAWGAAKFAGRAALWTATKAVPGVIKGAVGLVGAPVAITIAALAVTYYTVKYFRNRLKPMQKVRYTQYGLPPNDRDYWFPVAELENDLKDRIVVNPNGTADFSGKLDWNKYLSYFKIDPQNEEQVQRWGTWFNHRFKPVFLTHLALIRNVDPKCNIMEVDEMLHDGYKVEVAKGSRFKKGAHNYPYDLDSSPYPDKKIVVGDRAIVAAINAVIDKFAKVKRPTVVSEADKPSNQPNAVKDETTTTTRDTNSTTDTVKAVVDAKPAVVPAAIKTPTDTISVVGSRPKTMSDLARERGQVAPITAQYAAVVNKDSDEKVDRPLTASKVDGHIRVDRRSLESQVRAGAERAGYDPDRLVDIARAISGLQFNRDGLFGFTPDEWQTLKRLHFETLGIKPTDKVINTHHEAAIAAEYFKQLESVIAKMSGEEVSTRQLILAKKLGSPATALSVLNANGDEPIARYITKTEGVRDINTIIKDDEGNDRTISSYLAYIDSLIDKRVLESLPKYTFEEKSKDLPTASGANKPAVVKTNRPSVSDAMMVQREEAEKKRDVIARESVIAQQEYGKQTSTSLINATDILRSSLDVQRSMDKSLNQAVTHLAKLVAISALRETKGMTDEEREAALLEKLEVAAEERAAGEVKPRGFSSILSMRRNTTT